MRLVGRLVRMVTVVLWGLAVLAALAGPATAAEASVAAPIRLSADLACLPFGGADITFTVSNPGREPIVLADDFHLFLEKVTRGGIEPVGVVFVFPIEELKTIAPGGSSTFQVPIGDGVEGEPGADLTARRLILEAEVFFEGRDRPVTRTFTFPGCDA